MPALSHSSTSTNQNAFPMQYAVRVLPLSVVVLNPEQLQTMTVRLTEQARVVATTCSKLEVTH
jgi:hypothetical protein